MSILHITVVSRTDRYTLSLHDALPICPDAGDTTPSHHWMHYTDVPVLDAEKYGDGKTGRGNWDIVHTIPYCIGVLRGEIRSEEQTSELQSLRHLVCRSLLEKKTYNE